MAVHLFFNPDLVGQLAACGITARRRAAPGFVLEDRRSPARAREAVTNVIAVQGHVTITGPRPAERSTVPRLPASTTASEPQTALELIEECARLRRDNQRLVNDVTRLRSEIERLTGGARQPESQPLDDSAQRFAMLELD